MISLKSILSPIRSIDLGDMFQVKSALGAFGYLTKDEAKNSPYPNKRDFDAIKSFQKDHDLDVDGIMNPDGPTVNSMNNKLAASDGYLGAFKDFAKSYLDMRDANTVGADKYFHCKANYNAARRGPKGDEAATYMSDRRETFGLLKGDPSEDMGADQNANVYGRRQAKSGLFSSSEDACDQYRPKGLDEKY